MDRTNCGLVLQSDVLWDGDPKKKFIVAGRSDSDYAKEPITRTSVSGGRVIHVPADSATIQAGINGAVDGDTVLVADGIYTGNGNRDIEFEGKAILLMSENGPENCVIDCEGNYQDQHRGS